MKKSFIAIFLLMSVAAYADTMVVFQQDWTSYADGQYNAGSSIGGWTVANGSVDVLGPIYHDEPCLASGGGIKCIDLAGANPGTFVSPDFTFNPGSAYELTFQLAGSHKNNTNQVLVTLGNLFSQTYTLYVNDGFTTYSTGLFTVGAPTVANVTFQDLSPVYSGALLGTVTLIDPPASPASSVPEPMSLALIGSGLAATAFKRRFRKKS